MKKFSITTLNALASESACILLFMEIEMPNVTKRLSDTDITLYYGGNRFDPHPIEIEVPMYSLDLSVDSAEVSISDIDKSFSYEVQTSDVLRSPVTIYIAVMGNDYQIASLDILSTGLVDSWDLESNKLQLTVSNIFRSWHKKTLRKTRSSCQWYWKSTECGYKGTSLTPCNQSVFQCNAYGNRNNYGGFRFVDILQDAKIYWGREAD